MLSDLIAKWKNNWDAICHFESLKKFGTSCLFRNFFVNAFQSKILNFVFVAIRKSWKSNNGLESLNKEYNLRCISNKTRKIIKTSFQFMSDRAQVKRLQPRKRNTQTIQRQQIQAFKQNILEFILNIDADKLCTQNELEQATRSIFEKITASINLTHE